MSNRPISQDQIDSLNTGGVEALVDEYGSLGRQLSRRGIDIDAITPGKIFPFSKIISSLLFISVALNLILIFKSSK